MWIRKKPVIISVVLNGGTLDKNKSKSYLVWTRDPFKSFREIDDVQSLNSIKVVK